jgi:hypothetical protein
MNASATNDETDETERGWTAYLPLIILILLSALSAAAIQLSRTGSVGLMSGMHDFMGMFLVIFSMFKLFDLSGFADGFEKYDLLAKRFRPYGFVYPFFELGLGLAYFARWQMTGIYMATIVLMVFGATGVLTALKQGLDINCPCMGTVLDVPLSTVTLTEDFGMAIMALVMLLWL